MVAKMQKRGYVGDAGFYFWLSHAAISQDMRRFRKCVDQLLELDPDKEGFEPWRQQENEFGLDALEHDRDFIVEKLESTYTSERILVYFTERYSA